MTRMHISTFAPITLALAALSIVACTPAPTVDDDASSSTASSTATVDRTDREEVAAAILDAFAAEDWITLSTYTSPAGVRFTPYTYIHEESDRVLMLVDLLSFGSDPTTHTWGIQEGSGEPIDMTNMEYLARYVWDHDYRTADETNWNENIVNHGSMIDNSNDVYPDAEIVEYYFDGFEEQYGGMDWRSLRLVLEEGDDGNYALVGVIHDEWTP